MACYLKSKTLVDISNQLKMSGKNIVLTHGAFDLFHVGQMEFLKQSKKLGDYLMVGIDSDERIQKYKGSNRPIIPLEQRVEILLENKSIDFVFAINENRMDNNFFLKLYHQFNPSVLTCGVNFAYQKNFQERQKLFKECNFTQITHKYDYQSTTKIIKEIKKKYSIN